MSLSDKILDFLFPKKCVGCQRQGTWFCQDCQRKIIFLDRPLTRYKNSPLSGVIAVALFKNPLKEATHAFKYDGVKELCLPLSRILINHLRDLGLPFLKKAILIPIPLSKSKEKERGFNQSLLLAEEIGKELNLKVFSDALLKIKNPEPQMKLKGKERRENIKGVFALKKDLKIKNKTILLVDDVMTTGSTLKEAAKVLKKGKPKSIWGLVIARE